MKIILEMAPETSMDSAVVLIDVLSTLSTVEQLWIDDDDNLTTIKEYLTERFKNSWSPGFDLEFDKEFYREYKTFYEKEPKSKRVHTNGRDAFKNAYTKEELVFASVVLDEKFPGAVETIENLRK